MSKMKNGRASPRPIAIDRNRIAWVIPASFTPKSGETYVLPGRPTRLATLRHADISTIIADIGGETVSCSRGDFLEWQAGQVIRLETQLTSTG